MTTQTLPEVAVVPTGKPPRRRRVVIVLVLLLLLVVTAAAIRARSPEQKADIREGTTLVSAAGMAARYGIDVNLIGVTAAGGLIEIRYQVVDPDRADPVIHDADLTPIIVVEDTGVTLVLRSAHHHKRELQLGGTYFFLIANAHNAIHPGSLVTLVIGDARLEHVVAQG
ncbi:hypothetical protein [Nocardioides sp.]|jgi:hypothetical protein|uniref:hypothetical protein n=1 Tax=Nocardioides sp. TaxID=35761 RepID=UPI0031FEB39B|nr:hypothetical protein [Nocardioides sp.]